MNFQLVTGAGPVGWTVAEQLAAQGHSVRVLTRSGSGPVHPLVERRSVDVSDASQLRKAADGAAAIFHCIHGSAYTSKAWERELPGAERTVLAAAESSGAIVVFPESLYAYDRPEQPMTETASRAAATGKRGVRSRLLRARAESGAATVSVVASDFFGPRVLNAHAGERMVPAVLAGKAVRVVGRADVAHSFTFVPDLAAAMIAAAAQPQAWNSVLHAPSIPALTQAELAAAFANAAGLPVPAVKTLPGRIIRAAGLLSTDARELAEMLYQFEAPFVLDSAHSQALLGLTPTPLAVSASATVRWWQERALTRRSAPSSASRTA